MVFEGTFQQRKKVTKFGNFRTKTIQNQKRRIIDNRFLLGRVQTEKYNDETTRTTSSSQTHHIHISMVVPLPTTLSMVR